MLGQTHVNQIPACHGQRPTSLTVCTSLQMCQTAALCDYHNEWKEAGPREMSGCCECRPHK
jgi:hypothetical protein